MYLKIIEYNEDYTLCSVQFFSFYYLPLEEEIEFFLT
jgi:hypothetical protein